MSLDPSYNFIRLRLSFLFKFSTFNPRNFVKNDYKSDGQCNETCLKASQNRLYQSEGETEGALKGKPGRKKQKFQKQAFFLEFLRRKQHIPWRSRNNNRKKFAVKNHRPQYSSYADGYQFSFMETRCIT